MEERPEGRIERTATQARQASKEGVVRYVLAGGLVLVIIGVGPQSTPDVVYHIGLIVCLVAGLVAAIGTPRPTATTG